MICPMSGCNGREGVVFLALFGGWKYESEVSIGVGVGVGVGIVTGCGMCK